MSGLLDEVIDAHGGIEHWKRRTKVSASIVSGGGLFALKGLPQDSEPRLMTVWLHEQRASVRPFGAPDQRTMFTGIGSRSRNSMVRWSPSAMHQGIHSTAM